MFPTPPYDGFTWPITQHMGVINEVTLSQILLAAMLFSEARDPGVEITNYLVVNKIFTPNVRSDSGQADAWRDYQQVLSESGLIYSTKVQPLIKLTALGLMLLDNEVTFNEVMTIQSLRYQYPNGHKTVIDSGLQNRFPADFQYSNLSILQEKMGVRIRPTVLIWRILRRLSELGFVANLTIDEIQSYAMRCSRHSDTELCVQAIISARNGGTVLPKMPRGRRNSQDWIKFLGQTLLFTGGYGQNAYIRISDYGRQVEQDVSEVCAVLERDESFWKPGVLDI